MIAAGMCPGCGQMVRLDLGGWVHIIGKHQTWHQRCWSDNTSDAEPTEEEIAIAKRYRIAKDVDRFPGWTLDEIHRWVQTGKRR